MTRPVSSLCFFLLLGWLAGGACTQKSRKPDVSSIELEMVVERFDQDLFGANPDSLDRFASDMYAQYGDFFDVFNVHVIRIGPASARRYASYLSMFINDPTNREVFEYTSSVFASLEESTSMLEEGFRHYLYYYPDSTQPRVVAYVSRFNQGLFTVGDMVGVGLDQYLGEDCAYYQQMGTPRYLVRNKVPERIPVDVIKAWATRLFPYNDSSDNVLNRMIHKGMLAYFLEAMYPHTDDQFRMGFTEDQMRWCRNNERQMWTYLVEHKLLFSKDPMEIRKLTEDAPQTQFFTTESPGRAANWIGLQIVRAYARRNKQAGLAQLMAIRDYQEILRASRYDP